MLGLPACSESYEFGQLGTELSRFRSYTVPKMDKFFKETTHPCMRGDYGGQA